MKNNPTPRTGTHGPMRKDATSVENVDRKVSKESGRELYRLRQQMVEPVFGQIKEPRGIRRFMRRGKSAADSEWKLIAGSHNLLKLYRRALSAPATVPYSRNGGRRSQLNGLLEPRGSSTRRLHRCPRRDQHAETLDQWLANRPIAGFMQHARTRVF